MTAINKENSKVFLLTLLGMLSAFGPFVTDMYLPSLPAMADYFSASFINGKTNCSTFTKHFVPNLILLTQNKMCILLRWFHLFTSFVYLCISLA